jgi:uncharacterized FAD-dependent dehydrogenase
VIPSHTIDIAIQPEYIDDRQAIALELQQYGIPAGAPFRIIKRSVDARKKQVLYRLRIETGTSESLHEGFSLKEKNVTNSPEVYIAGAGPCGLFAAVRLIEQGLKPIILERGKDVRERRRDLAAINKDHIVNPESNYCFGEGGAGTYSDGKLYTRSKKRGSIEEVLQYLVAFGAPDDILIDAHPHIGTNKLPKLIENMRAYITACGGEIRFNTKLTDLKVQSGVLTHIETNSTEHLASPTLILATGHSARDIFELLHQRAIAIEAKPFALGVRIEHPQQLIDSIQYHCPTRSEHLPPASYSMVHQASGKGVYSFCMCPGGIIAPCATAPGEIVTNGWSPSKRNNPFANSGMVVSIDPADYDPKRTRHPLAALEYQRKVEVNAYALGGGGQTAPAQRMVDFVNRRVSSSLPRNSYVPGLASAELRDCLPNEVSSRLSEALAAFGKKMPAYFTNEAVLVATESRTSSPVRIPRGDDLQHPGVAGLYPAGEGAGYAGGIVSAAMDGIRVAEAISIKARSGV